MKGEIEGEIKARIQALSERDDFEPAGDAEFLDHPDPQARLLWAFYRPSGSHPDQLADPEIDVAAMAFNMSRLSGYERFSRLNPKVLETEEERIKIAKRARMLFRAMADGDFHELVQSVEAFPLYLELAVDQVIHGRRWNETEPDPAAVSRFLELAEGVIDDRLLEGIAVRFPPAEELDPEEAKRLLDKMEGAGSLHPALARILAGAIREWLEGSGLHALQKKVIAKRLERWESGS